MDLEFPKRPKCDPFRFYPPALCIGAAPTLKHRSPSFNPSDLSLHHVCHSPPRPFFSSFSLSPLLPHFPSSRPLPLRRGLSSFLLLLSVSLPPLSNPPPSIFGVPLFAPGHFAVSVPPRRVDIKDEICWAVGEI